VDEGLGVGFFHEIKAYGKVKGHQSHSPLLKKPKWSSKKAAAQQQQQQGVCHTVALPFTLKSILRQNEELWKPKYFSPCKNLIFQKSSKKRTKILQDIITL
jgi:hypothetical protein